MRRAKPNDIKRARIIRVMGFRFVVAIMQRTDRPWLDTTVADGVSKSYLCSTAQRVFEFPFLYRAFDVLLALFSLGSLSVISKNTITSFPIAMRTDITFRTNLAFVKVAVSHSIMFIELGQRL